MQLLLDREYLPDLEALLARPDGHSLDVWSFDDAPTRRAAEAEFARRGIVARCRSALKPLLCAFREEIDPEGLDHAVIHWPDPPDVPPGRFLIETWPLAQMLPRTRFEFRAWKGEGSMPVYAVDLHYGDGRSLRQMVLAPNRRHRDAHGRPLLSPCGWLIRDGKPERLRSRLEAMLEDAIAACEGLALDDPCRRIVLAVTLPAVDEPLGVGDEALSLVELLHEEIYFGLLERFQARAGRAAGDRSLQIGQIVPDIRRGPRMRLRVETHSLESPAPLRSAQVLDRAERALDAGQVADELAALGGVPLLATSAAGRPVHARLFGGADRAMILTAGQHGNETSGPVAALRAARRISRRPGAHLAVCPLENPDGYALQAQLAEHNPRHLLHAARYTALGDDLEYRKEDPPLERTIRDEARARTAALLQVSLHGYPAHEWSRPLSGYLPAGFEDWTMPRGFFLILRHRPEWSAAAEVLMELVARRLSQDPAIAALNRRQRRGRGAYLPPGLPLPRLIGAMECQMRVDPDLPLPMLMITEYPDETLMGPEFTAAHDAQLLAARAAYAGLQALDPGLLHPGGGRDAAIA